MSAPTATSSLVLRAEAARQQAEESVARARRDCLDSDLWLTEIGAKRAVTEELALASANLTVISLSRASDRTPRGVVHRAQAARRGEQRALNLARISRHRGQDYFADKQRDLALTFAALARELELAGAASDSTRTGGAAVPVTVSSPAP